MVAKVSYYPFDYESNGPVAPGYRQLPADRPGRKAHNGLCQYNIYLNQKQCRFVGLGIKLHNFKLNQTRRALQWTVTVTVDHIAPGTGIREQGQHCQVELRTTYRH
jgi:hypothetical protein